ncbi:hypothetical protein [Pseudomonas sp. HY7a-MNA-CIBAN-0227]|uniref:hypothetical protein n=1 Tax=Pseudomonas sp. HY7a-MNA-CIBAN-0227 TaxID=3140474 RepID=UPI00331BE843
MLTQGNASKEYLSSVFSDFAAGDTNKTTYSDLEIDYIINTYYKAAQKHINIRDGKTSQRTVLVGISEVDVFLSSDIEFSIDKVAFFEFIRRSTNKNSNSQVVNAFRQSTKEGFEASLEIDFVS